MEIELMTLIKKYLLEIKPVDENFIIDCAAIITKHLKIEDYLQNINFYKEDQKNILSNYTLDTRTLNFYWNTFFRLKKIPKNHKFEILEVLFATYLFAIEVLAHELEHAHQFSLVDFHHEDLKTEILRATTKIFREEYYYNPHSIMTFSPIFNIYQKLFVNPKKEQKMNEYYQNYLYAPFERMADLEARGLILKIIAAKKDALINLHNFYADLLLRKSLQPYYDELNPTKYYFKQMGLETDWQNLQIPENLPLEERYYLGLEISPEEHSKIANLEQKYSH